MAFKIQVPLALSNIKQPNLGIISLLGILYKHIFQFISRQELHLTQMVQISFDKQKQGHLSHSKRFFQYRKCFCTTKYCSQFITCITGSKANHSALPPVYLHAACHAQLKVTPVANLSSGNAVIAIYVQCK